MLLPYFKFFLVLYFLIAMHIIFDTPGGVGLYFSYNIFAWIITSILISLGLWQITLNRKLYYSKTLLCLALGCTLLIIPVFYQFEFTDHAIPRLIALVGGFLFLASLYQFDISKRESLQLLLIILLAVLIEACFGIIQFLFFESGDWGGYIVGKSRPHGVFLQPNVMASFMATGFVISLFFSVNSKIFKNLLLHRWLVILSLFITTFLLVLLQSRTGLVSAFIVLCITAPYIYLKNKKQLTYNLITIIFAICVALISLKQSSTPNRDLDRLQTTSARSSFYVVSVEMIKQQPILGYGYGGFERSFIDYFNQYAINNPEIGDTVTGLSHPHNEILYWVVEGGVITVIAFTVFIYGYFILFRRYNWAKSLVIFALPLPIIIHCQLEYPFYSSAGHWLIFLILLWFTEQQSYENEQQRLFLTIEPTFLIRFFALFIPSIAIPFLVTTSHTANILVEYERSTNKSLANFTHIINPIAWQSRLDAAVFSNILLSGIREKDVNKLTTYLDWATKRIRHKPRVILYQNCLYILEALEQNEAYDKLLKDAKRTYPQQDNWQSLILAPIKIKNN